MKKIIKEKKNNTQKGQLLIYFGAVIFFILVLILGITIYTIVETTESMKNRTAEIERENEEKYEEGQEMINNNNQNNNDGNIQSASNNIGKSIEEQENSNESVSENTNESSITTTIPNENKIDKEQKEKNEETTTTKKQENKSVETNAEPTVVKEEKKELNFAKPIEGEIICEYAKENLIYSETLKEWITHTAIDIKADKTSVVKSAEAGIIKRIVNDPRYGLTIVIEHDDGYETVYSNLLTSEFVVEGEEVQKGQTIATVGNTASFESNMETHLHFELLKDGEYLDPNIYLK